MTLIFLKPGREKSVRQRHPWIFSGAVDRITGSASAGDTVEVLSADGQFLGRAAYSPQSQIRLRLWTWDAEEQVNTDFFRLRIRQAVGMRRELISDQETDALRLVNGESDGLPGVIVDRYAGVLVLQCLTAGAERWRDTITQILAETTGIREIFERSDVDVRKLEGMEERRGAVMGNPPCRVIIQENGLKFQVDICEGQKTGFYIDQRRNRQRVGMLVRGLRVLNCFAYTGGFTVYALVGEAKEVISVDSSADALLLAAENVALNNLPTGRALWKEGDVFHVLRELRDRGEHFDAIILDPPKFAPTASQAQQAARGYKDINLLGLKLLNPGGLLFTFSCSGGVNQELFQKIVAGAALDAGVTVQVVEHLSQGIDHPTALNYPEGAYLKGLVCRRV